MWGIQLIRSQIKKIWSKDYLILKKYSSVYKTNMTSYFLHQRKGQELSETLQIKESLLLTSVLLRLNSGRSLRCMKLKDSKGRSLSNLFIILQLAFQPLTIEVYKAMISSLPPPQNAELMADMDPQLRLILKALLNKKESLIQFLM